MTFNDPVVGGQTLIRPAIQSPNFQSGTSGQGQGWSINEDGSAEFNNLTTNGQATGPTASYDDLSANNTFTYQGTELSDIIAQFPQGVIASGVFLLPTGSVSTQQIIGGLTWVAQDNRYYEFVISDVTYTNPTFAAGHGGEISLLNDGVNVGNFQEFIGNAGDSLGHTFSSFSNGGIAAGAHTLTVGIAAQPTTDSITVIAHHATVLVKDHGPAVAETGFAGTISGPSSHSFTMNAVHSASYQGGGAQSNGSGADIGDRMYFGEDPGFAPNGNWRSYAWFNSGTNLSSMAGFVSCSKFQVTVNIPWWYAIAGGTLYIGHHNDNSGSPPGSEPASHAYQEVSQAFTARGQTKTISLLGNATIMAAVKAGTFKGIILGPGPTTSFNYYGYGEGSDHSLPQISATYLK